MAFYFDTSALVKLVTAEPESAALATWISGEAVTAVSSDLARTELLRAVRRVSPELSVRARDVLDAVILLQMGTPVFERAGLLDPHVLRSLDALHVAAALELGDDLEGLVTYDERLAEAAERTGIRVVAPR